MPRGSALSRSLLHQTLSAEPKKPSYYQPEIGEVLAPKTREALRRYIGLSDGELEPHLYQAVSLTITRSLSFEITYLLRRVTLQRDQVWKVAPYPCVGMWLFLRPALPRHPRFESIKESAKAATPGSYLVCDVGTGLGQELRSLTMEGVDSRNLRAIDVTDAMWNTGFALYKDRDRMAEAGFAKGNVLGLDEGPFQACKETVDVVIAGNLLHLFSWQQQVVAMKNLISLTKNKPGAMVVGWQLGGIGKQLKSRISEREIFYHTEQTFRDIMREIDEDIELKWYIEPHLRPLPQGEREKLASSLPENADILLFTLVRK